MQVIIELDPNLATRLRNEPEVRHLSMSDAMVELTRRTLQQLEDERSPDVFAAKCMEHVAKFEKGKRFGIIQAIPHGETFDSTFLRAVTKALTTNPELVRLLSDEEQVLEPLGRRNIRVQFERI
jgi:hypothetical protein